VLFITCKELVLSRLQRHLRQSCQHCIWDHHCRTF